MSKFRNIPGLKKINDVAKFSSEKTNIIQVLNISNENLYDYPKNSEDISDTKDLEVSMKELGFTDPIEVTDYSMPDGDYMIVSGHRRRQAGLKVGVDVFPSILRHFDNNDDLMNYVLFSNSQRDSSKDPLLYSARYKMHEEYLKSIDFEFNIMEEIAKRLGISKSQAARYKQFNKIILPVWDLVRSDKVGMSSVLPMSNFHEEEQIQIYNILLTFIENEEKITREKCKDIISLYSDGFTTYEEIITKANKSHGETNDEPKKQSRDSRYKNDVKNYVNNVAKLNKQLIGLKKLEGYDDNEIISDLDLVLENTLSFVNNLSDVYDDFDYKKEFIEILKKHKLYDDY